MSRVLLVNPWIEDFTAYDLWLRPLGLLHIGALLEAAGADVTLLDCLAREAVGGLERFHATGRFPAVRTAKPAPLAGTRRHYYRFGMSDIVFNGRLAAMAAPDFVFLGSAMTYWYGGVFRAARRLRAAFPRARIVLGGVYATLCPEHARRSGLFDDVVSAAEPAAAATAIAAVTGLPVAATDPPRPAYHLYGHPLRHAAKRSPAGGAPSAAPTAPPRGCFPVCGARRPLRFSTNCGRRWRSRARTTWPSTTTPCSPTASATSGPSWRGIARWRPPVRFHLPNAVHPRYIDGETAWLLRTAGFATVRLGFEGMGEAARERSSGKVDQARRGGGRLRRRPVSTAREVPTCCSVCPALTSAELETDIRYASTGWGSRSNWPAFRPSRAHPISSGRGSGTRRLPANRFATTRP